MVATRFAVAAHILLLLASEAGRGTTSLHIAGSVNTNPVVVRRITGQLARAGLVRVRRGPGGAELSRPASEITLQDVWRAVNSERTSRLLPLHARPNPECPVGRRVHAVLGPAFAVAERALGDALSATTLDRLVSDLAAGSAAG